MSERPAWSLYKTKSVSNVDALGTPQQHILKRQPAKARSIILSTQGKQLGR